MVASYGSTWTRAGSPPRSSTTTEQKPISSCRPTTLSFSPTRNTGSTFTLTWLRRRSAIWPLIGRRFLQRSPASGLTDWTRLTLFQLPRSPSLVSTWKKATSRRLTTACKVLSATSTRFA
uniref:Uncharacterized protein n=1 Tax=uncultured marine virus TaxID=186617 RepID=A0A0F7L2V8_9VIRU|nr:hypothetical protein [uncultured marine virus]